MRCFRFSLGSLCLFVLLLGSIATVWVRRKPWTVTREWKAHEGSTACVLSMDHGDELLTLGNGSDSSRENPKNELKVWDAQTGALLAAQAIEMDGDVDGAVFSPDENLLVVCCNWRAGSYNLPGPTAMFRRTGLTFIRQGCLWSAFRMADQFKDAIEFRSWIDARKWRVEPETPGLFPVTAEPSDIQFDCNKIYAGWTYSDRKGARFHGVFDIRTRREDAASILDDDIRLRTLSRDRSCALCYRRSTEQHFIASLPDFQPIAAFPSNDYCFELLDSRQMLTTDYKSIRRIDLSNNSVVWSFPDPYGDITFISMSSDQTRLLRATNDKNAIEIRDFATGAKLCTVDANNEWPCFDTNFNRLLSLDWPGGLVRIRERRFPEWWWGHLLRPEVWVLIVCAGLCAWRIVTHIKRTRREQLVHGGVMETRRTAPEI